MEYGRIFIYIYIDIAELINVGKIIYSFDLNINIKNWIMSISRVIASFNYKPIPLLMKLNCNLKRSIELSL